jgi:predicted ribosomally synthesized peptide with SipW-like signal peptide
MIAAMPATGLRAHNWMRWVLFSALGIGLLSLSAGSGTLAFFTTQVQSNNNTFTAGNLRFNILDSVSTTGQYPSVGSSLSLLNMKPGDTVYAPIQLNNVGNIAARYGIKYTTTTVLASNSNGGTISATGTTLVDSGRTANNGLKFDAPAYGGATGLVGDYVMITFGTDIGDFRAITSVTTPDTLGVAAWTTTPDGTSLYRVVKFAGTADGTSTVTTFVDLGATWTPNQWVGYTATQGANTGKVVSNTAGVLTVSPPMAGSPSGTYTISPTNLAPALNLGIVGKGPTGTASVSPPLASECTAAGYADGTLFAEQASGATSPARTLAPMLGAGETVSIVDGIGNLGTSMVATTGMDVLCMQVSWTDGGAPLSLTTQDNAFNGGNSGAYSTNIDFIFDGQ